MSKSLLEITDHNERQALFPELKPMLSYAPQVQVVSEPGKWHGNAMRFATKDEAYRSALSLLMRWSSCTDCRAIESTDAVNYVIVGDKEIRLEDGHSESPPSEPVILKL